jgi:uncharacterized membrane protein
MNPPPAPYPQDVPTAVLGWTVNFVAFIVSLQDIEQWLQISSLVVGNLVGLLTIYKLVRSLHSKKPVDTKNP